jgi:hypothetical protein
MWKVPSERVTLDLDGPSVEVEPIRSWNIHLESLHAWRVVADAEKPEAKYVALTKLYEQFVFEAQPTWDIADHRGPVPTTARGMARIPLDLQLAILAGWVDSYVVAEKPEREPLPFSVVESDAPSAVDAIFPSGPVNRELKRRLRKVA